MKNEIKNTGLRLMAGRGGYLPSSRFEVNDYTPEIMKNSQHSWHGGYQQQNRMIRDKRKTLDRAVLYSYQGAFVKKVSDEEEEDESRLPVRALINPNKLKQDYDDKIISVGYEFGFEPGTVFEWCNTHSFWIVYLQDLDELAYFRGDIRRCRYEISWLDEYGKEYSTYAAVRGPVETKINYIQKHQISVDNPNHSLNILMPLTPQSKKYFTRYSKFYLGGDETCWRVEATDWISMPGVLEINATEYYANEQEDDVDKGIVGSLIVKKVNPNSSRANRLISGEVFIKTKREYTYTYTGLDSDGSWSYDPKLPIEASINGNSITIKWIASYSGQFDLKYKDLTKTIVVESLF